MTKNRSFSRIFAYIFYFLTIFIRFSTIEKWGVREIIKKKLKKLTKLKEDSVKRLCEIFSSILSELDASPKEI